MFRFCLNPRRSDQGRPRRGRQDRARAGHVAVAVSRALGLSLISAGLLLAATPDAGAKYDFPTSQKLISTYCKGCHQGKAPAGGFDVAQIAAVGSLSEHADRWNTVRSRVKNGEMPPKGMPAPPIDQRESFTAWIDAALRAEACAGGILPGPSPIRRLNRDEYSSTVRDLLNIHINAGQALPADGAGGEGFDNAAETLFISPIHAEKYLEAARNALEYASKDPKSREVFLIAEPGATLTSEQAAQKVIGAFLPRAFRHPATDADVERFMALFRAAEKRKLPYDDAILYALRGILISPEFLFRLEQPNPSAEAKLVDDYDLASRLSYFLWGSMPDQELFDLAAKRQLNRPETLRKQIARMLNDTKSLEFSERFVEQWLGTRELGRDIKPDEKLFPLYYDDEVQSGIRYEPILYFQEVLAKNLSLLTLIDSDFTIATRKLLKLYSLDVAMPRKDAQQQPQRVELPAGSHRGGVLSMAAVLAVSSYPGRTSPVLRGKWILDAMLGTPPPPPPPGVPPLSEQEGAHPQTVRERLELHRKNPVCASCHSRIDPLGFALENYDVLGRWRTEDAGKPVDARGELVDGTKFEGPDQLKAALIARQDLFLRNLTNKMLGYSLGRGLTLSDSCTVDQILEHLKANQLKAQTLVEEIVLSVPFRYQQPAPRTQSVNVAQRKEN